MQVNGAQNYKTMKHILYFLLIPFFAFAQKSEQVKNYLGETKYMETPIAGKVNFVFQKGTLSRDSDGKKSFAELLKDGVGYSDADNAGRLKGITENGVLIRPYVRTQSAVVGESARPVEFDSMSFARQTEDLKRTLTFWESKMWQGIRPIWSVVMHLFWIIFPLILIACIVCWVWAKTAGSEEFPKIHYGSSRMLTLLILSTWTIFLISAILTIIGMEMGIVGTVFCGSICALIAYKSATWIIPNYRQKIGGRPQPNFHNRQLPG